MDAKLIRNYLRLVLAPELSVASFSRLLTHYTRLQSLLDSELHGETITTLLEKQNSRFDTGYSRALEWLKDDPRNRLLTYEDEAYPELLRKIDCAPPVLFLSGSPERLCGPNIAIIGARRCTSYGRQQARWLASSLSEAGLGICSGLARGIDTAAHEGALAAGGLTLAILGTGPDKIYPRGNGALAEKIMASGTLVSEFLPGTPPLAANFPRRNRIISGLSLGTLVIEASLRSGSLITARLAMEQNREVFALPGPTTTSTSRGCHRLIKSGAKLVESVVDVLEELQIPEASKAERFPARKEESIQNLGKVQKRIMAALKGHACPMESLQQSTGLGSEILMSALSELELAGMVEARGGRFCEAPGFDLPRQKG